MKSKILNSTWITSIQDKKIEAVLFCVRYFSLTLFSLAVIFAVDIEAAERWHQIAEVIDGDTLILDNNEKVRLIGVDTAEIIDDYGRNVKTARWTRIDASMIADYAFKAKAFVQKWLEGERVRLEFDPSNRSTLHRDEFGRILAYVYRESDNARLNAVLVQEGYGLTYRKFDFKYRNEYLLLEKDAKDNRRGFWRYQK